MAKQPRKLTQEELAIIYEVLGKVTMQNSKNTLLKGGIMVWLEEQAEVPNEEEK